jgi:hypothetical protein
MLIQEGLHDDADVARHAMCLAWYKGVAADSFVFTLGRLKNYRGGIAR